MTKQLAEHTVSPAAKNAPQVQYAQPVPRQVDSRASKAPSPKSAPRRPDGRPGRTIRSMLDAGFEELKNVPYADLTMRAIAARAGVSVASAYRYFPSKSALVASLYLELLRAAPSASGDDPSAKTRVLEAMRGMLLVGVDEPELMAACAAALTADDAAVLPIRKQVELEVRRILSEALGSGWSPAVPSTLLITFSGAVLVSQFRSSEEITEMLKVSVNLILGASVT